MATAATTAARATAARNPWPGVIALAFAASVSATQNAVVIPLLPVLQRELDASLAAVSWTFTIGLLVSAVATPLLSRFGDMYGKRRMVLGALALLIVGSIVAAVATTLPWLIVGRVLQGFSSALIPLAIGVVRDVLPRQQLPTGIGVISATMGFGSGGGMILAGLVADDYATLFWVAAALAAVGAALVVFLIRDTAPAGGGRPDFVGAALMTVWLVALLLAITQGSSWGWTSWATLGLFAVAVVAAVVWVQVERRVAQPLVQMAMLVHRSTVGATVASMLLGFCLFLTMTGVSGFMQGPTLRASVLQVGLYLLPSTLLMLVMSLFAGRLMRRFTAASLVGTGSAVTGASGLWLVFAHDGPADLLVATSLLGLGLGVGYAALGTMAVEHVRPEQTAAAAGINALVRIAGGSMAGAVTAAILAALPGVHGYQWIFGVAAGAGAMAAVFAFVYGRLNRDLASTATR
jgi:MFS family permease